MRKFAALIPAAILAGCASTPEAGRAPPSARPAATPPMTQQRPPPVQSTGGFIAPRVMNLPGLEDVIGKDSTALANLFGAPRLQVREGDAIKMQFGRDACVLDVYLYPLAPRAEPTATYVEARRASDALEVDRAACVAALRR